MIEDAPRRETNSLPLTARLISNGAWQAGATYSGVTCLNMWQRLTENNAAQLYNLNPTLGYNVQGKMLYAALPQSSNASRKKKSS